MLKVQGADLANIAFIINGTESKISAMKRLMYNKQDFSVGILLNTIYVKVSEGIQGLFYF